MDFKQSIIEKPFESGTVKSIGYNPGSKYTRYFFVSTNGVCNSYDEKHRHNFINSLKSAVEPYDAPKINKMVEEMESTQPIKDLKESINPVSLILAAKVKTFDQKQIDDITKRIDGLKVKDKANITELLDNINLEFHGTHDSMVASILKALDINEEGAVVGSADGPMSTASIGGQYAVPLVDSQSGKTIVMKRRKSYDESFFDHMKETLNEESSKNKAEEWFNSLSINDQKKYTNMHPFYSKMDGMHVIQAKNGIKELYKYLIDKNLIKKEDLKEDKPMDESFIQWKCANCGYASSDVEVFQHNNQHKCPSCGSNIVRKFIRESVNDKYKECN
jgi:rubrerythrin